MSIPKKPIKLLQNLFRQMRKLFDATAKAVANALLRSWLRVGKRPNLTRAGFALPTAMMVMLVVILLTTALVIRSMDRNRNAILARSEQVIQNSSTPALDRAKAKLTALLADPNLPRGTPPDEKLLEVMQEADYTFGDETRLKIAFDLNRNQTLDPASSSTPENDETLNTVWKYPVDTDGNGKFDSFSLYGIYWRNPVRQPAPNQNQYEQREPLHARSLPQDTQGVGQVCKAAGQTAATSVGDSDWYKQGSTLSKAFYVYAATVPISDVNQISTEPFPRTKFENNPRADKAFSGLEYEQDRYRSGLNNNAIWYQNDLILNPGGRFYLNGRVFTNGNLLAGAVPPSGEVRFHQVSSIWSCFYEKENAVIQVGGNVGTGDVTVNAAQQPTTVDLFQGPEQPIQTGEINATTQSTDKSGGRLVANNDNAYEQRIALMRDTALSFCTNCATTTDKTQMLAEVAGVAEYSDPDLQKSFQTALDADTNNDPYPVVKDQIEIYLRNRTRRVPYAEIGDPAGTGATAPYDAAGAGVDASVFSGSTIGGLEPPAEWREPLNGNTLTNTSPSVNLVSANLRQTNPDTISTNNPVENELGDRVLVGNNLPALWKDSTGKYVGQNLEKQEYTDGTQWTVGGGTRYRISQVEPLENLGAADRGDFWEQAAASLPTPPSSDPNAAGTTGGGGLRIVTGAGIYVDDNAIAGDTPSYPRAGTSFLPLPTWDTRFVDPNNADPNKIHPDDLAFNSEPPIVVWSDLMPMTGGNRDSGDSVQDNLQKGDLLMRATAVYHYTETNGSNQNPIACVSSYYDPTTAQTARNEQQLPDVSGGIDTNGDGVIDQEFGGQPKGAQRNGKSNNGVVYNYPGFTRRARYNTELQRQARLVFPDGRIVNQPLRDALSRAPGTPFTFAQRSAIDSAICALAILKKEVQRSTVIPDGSIREAAFLDAREIKAIDKLTPRDPNYDINQNYDLPLEERQPLEVRVTDINLRLLASTPFNQYDVNGDGQPEQEYLLPLSGIVYATRDDALADASNPDATLSSTDFRLDPTRRPNGIRLINGMRLARGTGNNYNNTKEEKGLILATNLPAYVKGTFNPHTPSEKTEATDPSFNGPELEEFTAALQANWGNFYTRGAGGVGDLETRFACRQGQPLCTGNGDQWRPATIIADAVTLQSSNFQDGYRNQGDFDLRNNGGSALTGRRVNNGFFDNSFVTSADWSDPAAATPGPAPASRVSYLVNGVTPIQRRAYAVAYKTEICRKLPVSSCTAQDWKTTNSPDTSERATGADVRYARRVAFTHVAAETPPDPNTGDTTPTGYFKYYYDTNGYPQLSAAPIGPQNNALWFVTRDAQGNPSYDGGNAPATQQPLIFEPRYPANYPVAALQNLPQLPDLKWLRGYLAASPSQNLPMPDNLADHTGPIPASGAPSGPADDFGQRRDIIRSQFFGGAFPANMRFTLPYEKQFLNFSNSEPNRTIDLTGGGKMRVFFITGGLNLLKGYENTVMPIQGDEGSVYVFLVSGNLNVKQGANLGTVLGQTVLPDNVYWLVNGDVGVGRNATLKGNVLASGTIYLDRNAKLEGRAISTQQTVNLAGGSRPATIIAPAGNQPRLVPVTQIQSPDGDPRNSAATLERGTDSNYPNLWLQQATSTIYNAAFVVGDSPIRPQETSAGLNNLVRLQENWNPSNGRQNVNIKGSFIQQTRSSVATGPFAPIRLSGDAPHFTTPEGALTIFGYSGTNPNKYFTNNGQINPGGLGRGTQPYYNTPGRQWGFDIGLLSQSPDLFSQKFTTDIPKLQNFYRQVGRDDPWIQTLLCAKEPNNPTDAQRGGQDAPTYNKYVVPEKDRPNCRSATGVGASVNY